MPQCIRDVGADASDSSFNSGTERAKKGFHFMSGTTVQSNSLVRDLLIYIYKFTFGTKEDQDVYRIRETIPESKRTEFDIAAGLIMPQVSKSSDYGDSLIGDYEDEYAQATADDVA